MDEPVANTLPEADLAELREQVRSLRGLLKLMLVSIFIVTAALCLFLYRQTSLMKRQVDAQQAALKDSQAKEREIVLRGLETFRQYGARDPVYASNILSKFGLSPLGPTNSPAPAAPKKP
jgi:hypothetical protein